MHTTRVMVVLAVAVMAALNAHAALIFYESFEAPTLAGWTADSAGVSGAGITGKTGNQVAVVHKGGQLTTEDTYLTNTLTTNMNYTLTCDVTYNNTDPGKSGPPLADMELRAGTRVISVVTNVVTAANNLSATTMAITFVVLSGHPDIGETLGIRVRNLGRWYRHEAYFDNMALHATSTTNDFTAPTPTNMSWVDLPTSSESNSITMMATNAVDENWVEYFFTNTLNGNTSGWQDSRIWTDRGPTPGESYGYRVKARDRSANTNETEWSSEESVECEEHIILHESFEEPSILPKTQLSFGTWPLPPDGWGYSISGSLHVWHDNRATVSTPFGEQYVAGRAGSTITARDLGHVLEPDYTYRATFNCGGMNGGGGGGKPASLRVDLIAGSTVVTSETVSATTADLTETGELEFIPDDEHPNLGESLQLKLTVSSTPSYWNDRGQVDNIKVYAIPPPPAGTVLVIR